MPAAWPAACPAASRATRSWAACECDPGDTAGLARALADLLADPAERARMGQAGYERTMAERTWDHVTDTVEALYADVAGARRRRAMLPTP